MPSHAKVNEFNYHLDSEEPIRALVSQSGFVYLKFAIEQFIQCYFWVEVPIVSDSNKLSESCAADEEIDAAEIVVDGRDDQAVARPDEACNRIEENEWKGEWIPLSPVAARAVFWEAESLSAGRAKSASPAPIRHHLIVGAQKNTCRKIYIYNTYSMLFSSGL